MQGANVPYTKDFDRKILNLLRELKENRNFPLPNRIKLLKLIQIRMKYQQMPPAEYELYHRAWHEVYEQGFGE